MNYDLPRATLLALILVTAASCTPDSTRRERVDREYLQLLAAEDVRPTDGPELDRLIGATHGSTVFLRQVAVRALGRLENPELAHAIEALLDDSSPAVRSEAANALAQAHFTSPGGEAVEPLEHRIEVESDPAVRGELARAIGRLALGPADRAYVAAILVDMSFDGTGFPPAATLTGVALGSEALVRGARGRGIPERLLHRLDELATYPGEYFLDPQGDRVRALALQALGHAGAIRWAHIQRALLDERPEIGGTATRYLATVEEALRPEAIRSAAANQSPFTVLEVFRYIQAQPRTDQTCIHLFSAAQNPPPNAPYLINMGVRLTALDALADPCPDLAGQRTLLLDVARSVDAGAWRPATRALRSLAGRFPADAANVLPVFAQHDNPFVRVYAAQVAATLSDGAMLDRLLQDPIHNVRTAALQGLYLLRGHGAEDAARAQMNQDDPQLVMTAARLLEGAPARRSTAEASLAAFERLSAAQRETWRDVRMGLLARIAETGSADDSGRLIPYLSDYDPLVATEVANMLQTWNGRPYSARPQLLPRLALPTAAELRDMEEVQIVLHVREGGEIVIDLHPYSATTNTYRFYQMVRQRWFDGLTFHRWAPNFVIQGGSPHANEYFGDGPFTRDEVGATHWRGTVGISTRGHDTGDGQIFVNLMDNVRLDHAYTIVGT
ncbi:MAG: peptidylprolyl isomerase, partial [Candidatus Krumholzibacteria bacterium]|nr:peptidylprolyl isomerase [Candidatus Krumholzibacteria bacterium]